MLFLIPWNNRIFFYSNITLTQQYFAFTMKNLNANLDITYNHHHTPPPPPYTTIIIHYHPHIPSPLYTPPPYTTTTTHYQCSDPPFQTGPKEKLKKIEKKNIMN